MKFRTLDELSYFLRDDLGWRRKELHVMKSLVESVSHAKKQALLRGAVPALYAHWEGFVKTACRSYFDYVRGRKLRMNELCVPILSTVFRKRLKRVAGDETLDSHRDFADWLLNEWPKRAQMPKTEEIVSTSNLNSVVFKGFITGLGLPYVDDYARAEKPVIDELVNARNHLAHGEWKHLEPKEFDELYTWTTSLMDIVCSAVEDAAATNAYRRELPQIR